MISHRDTKDIRITGTIISRITSRILFIHMDSRLRSRIRTRSPQRREKASRRSRQLQGWPFSLAA